MALLQRALNWLYLFWAPKPKPIAWTPSIEPAVEKPLPGPHAVPKPKPSDAYGQFFFREQILDQLDDYFGIARRMRRFDPQAYALYSRIGAHIMPYKGDKWHFTDSGDEAQLVSDGQDGALWGRLSPWWKLNRPSFGAIALVHPNIDRKERQSAKKKPEDGGQIYPRFIYFTKYAPGKAPPEVELTYAGDIYVCTVYFTDKDRPDEIDLPEQFPIYISPDNEVRLLKVRMNRHRTINSKWKGYRQFSVRDRHWGIQPQFELWARQHKLTAPLLMRHLFIDAANTWEAAQYSMTRIDVRKYSMHAVFGVDIRRTPYFFRDRDVTAVSASGKRKRIFHIVRAFRRADGKTVKTHFRGERRFHWNGYEVLITVPGKHHVAMPEFSPGATSWERGSKPDDAISDGHLGHMLQKHIEGMPLKKAMER